MSPPKFDIFLKFPNFLRFPCLKSFCNSRGNSYTTFAILDVKFRFTCGELDTVKLYVCIYFAIIKNVKNTNKKNGNVRDYIIK